MLLAPRVEAAGEWKRKGYRSAAEQLAADAGTSVSAARSMLETSKRVAEQPEDGAGVAGGRAVGGEGRAGGRARSRSRPTRRTSCLELAVTAPVAKLREECAAGEGGGRRRRDVGADPSGTVRPVTTPTTRTCGTSTPSGTVDDGAVFVRVFEPIVDELFKPAHKEGRKEPTEAYAFDALIELARRASGETAETKKASSAPKLLGLVRVDHEALVRGHVEGDEVCEIAGLGPVPACGPASCSVTRSSSSSSPRVSTSPTSRIWDEGRRSRRRSPCGGRPRSAPSLDCTRVQRIEFDHREEWRKTHHTRLDEGDGLCGHCHDLKTHFGWALVEGTGKRPLVPPDDPRHPKNKPK